MLVRGAWFDFWLLLINLVLQSIATNEEKWRLLYQAVPEQVLRECNARALSAAASQPSASPPPSGNSQVTRVAGMAMALRSHLGWHACMAHPGKLW